MKQEFDAANREYTLLVVDDNDMNRDLMSAQFSRAGYSVMLASSGYQALDRIESHHIDLVLLDMMMPGMSGLDVLAEIRKDYSLLNLPVIIVTADDLEQSVITALQAGANDYLTKPLNLPVALARVKTQLGSRKLAALKDEFARFASHDLKKPLIVIQDIVGEIERTCKPGQTVT
ncbi:MAG TPA: response regulator, partial [Methylotenera sp.]|nr:response regulator [Methylotenera sp.]